MPGRSQKERERRKMMSCRVSIFACQRTYQLYTCRDGRREPSATRKRRVGRGLSRHVLRPRYEATRPTIFESFLTGKDDTSLAVYTLAWECRSRCHLDLARAARPLSVRRSVHSASPLVSCLVSDLDKEVASEQRRLVKVSMLVSTNREPIFGEDTSGQVSRGRRRGRGHFGRDLGRSGEGTRASSPRPRSIA